MSILTYPLGFIGGGKEFYNGVIENSLRFDVASTSKLTRTTGSGGNEDCWTASLWVKRGNTALIDPLMSSSPATGTWTDSYGFFVFNAGGNIFWQSTVSDSNTGMATTVNIANFVDPSAWYHIVVNYNSAVSQVLKKVNFYINGKEVPHTESPAVAVNADSEWMTEGRQANIGLYPNGSTYSGSHLTDIYNIDGYALGPENFGEYKNGAWIPKAYAGPPPRITDSSGYENTMIQYGDVTDYEKYYIGDSSFISAGGPATNPGHLKVQSSAGAHLSFPSGTDYTIDFWVYPTDDGTADTGGMMAIGHDASTLADGSDIMADDSTTTDWYPISLLYTDNQYWIMNLGGQTHFAKWAVTSADHFYRWNHISVVRSETGPNVGRINIYHNGVQVTNYTQETADSGTNTPDNIFKHAYLITTNQSEGKLLDFGGTNNSTNGQHTWFDEFRAVKGQALPPRFYFGSNYGDDSGVLPQRATTAHRFVDDERTTLLISGQSANNHARAVSLVDESGLHLDNVHYSNSTYSAYPTQDGVGKQFTISGPQNTTKESFIGNTSSILFDGVDDYLFAGRDVTDFEMGTGAFQADVWFRTDEKVEVSAWNNAILAYGGVSAVDSGWKIYGGQPLVAHTFWGSNAQDYTSISAPTTTITNDAAWHHVSFLRDLSDNLLELYIDGALANTVSFASSKTLNSHADADLEIGSSGTVSTTLNFTGYIEEIRAIKGSVDAPRIKWTHTQTAGAGNKNAYDAADWKVNGHEFTDDNATSLLVHGDAYGTTTNDTAGIFIDSASANSIHHALVSGGGSHHYKALTLKSDGTNGTSTTDDQGNTIKWCGSNSSVLFANGSSFDYGNTAIKFDGSHTPASMIYPTSLTGMDIGSASATISTWLYWQGSADSGTPDYTGAPPANIWSCFNGAGWTYFGVINNSDSGTVNGELKYKLITHQNDGPGSMIGYTDFAIQRNTWHQFTWAKSGTTSIDFYVDGIRSVASSTADVLNVANYSPAPAKSWKIGSGGADTDRFIGYIDDFQWNVGEALPPRFYLGNQTPESGGSLTAFKYATFNGTNQYYHKAVDDWEYASTQGTILAWVKLNSPSGWNTIFSNADADGSWNSYFHFSIITDGQLVLAAQTSQSSDVFGNKSAKLISTTGRWHLVGVTLDGNNDVRLYIDGVDAGEFGGESGFDKTGKWFNDVTTNTKIAIGGLIRSGQSNPFKGSISQVGVWGGSSGATGVLTEAQIKANYDLSRSADWTATSGV